MAGNTAAKPASAVTFFQVHLVVMFMATDEALEEAVATLATGEEVVVEAEEEAVVTSEVDAEVVVVTGT